MMLYAPNGVKVSASGDVVEKLLSAGFQRAGRPSSGRSTKAELLEQAEEHMTNPELHEAVEAAKKSPAKPRKRKRA